MLKSISIIAMAAILALASGYANETKGKVLSIPVDSVNPTDGRQMYSSYCAPCHGTEGRGNGPVAVSLKTQPVDLTMLAKSHGGKYPDAHVVSVLQFGSALPAHGSAQMPVWGPVLGKMNISHSQESAMRISNLSHYLKSIQEK